MVKEDKRLLHGHIQHLGDVLALKANLQCLTVITLPLTHLAGNGDIGQELHLDLDKPLPPTGFTAPALNVEREPPRSIAPHSGLRDSGKKLTDRSKGAGIGGGVAAGGASDRRLVDIDHLVNMLNADNAIALPCSFPRAIEELCQLLIQNIVNKGALA
ncbi:hypothetical protein ES703_77226 [subsurface metagenome]